MHLIKQIVAGNLVIQIFSINPDLVVDLDASAFEAKDDYEIRDITLNITGVDQVDIYDLGTEGPTNKRSFALI